MCVLSCTQLLWSYGLQPTRLFQARALERVAIPFSRGSSWLRDRTQASCIAGRFFTVWATRECLYVKVQLFWIHYWCCSVEQLCPTLCDPKDCSLPGSSVHGISQARILEWVPFPSPGGLPNTGVKLASPPSISCTGMQILYHWATWEAPRRG